MNVLVAVNKMSLKEGLPEKDELITIISDFTSEYLDNLTEEERLSIIDVPVPKKDYWNKLFICVTKIKSHQPPKKEESRVWDIIIPIAIKKFQDIRNDTS